MTVLVVGKGGTLGAVLAERLQAEAIELRARSPDGGEDARDLAARIAHASVIVNAGGPRVRPGLGWADYFREHVGVTARIVRSMQPGSHLVQISSTAVFGARGSLLSAADVEAPTLFPNAAYACAKLAAEMEGRALARERRIRVTVLRPSMVYGPGLDSALESIRRLSRRGVRLRLLPAKGRQHLVHIDLLAEVVARATLTTPRDGERVLLVADPFVLENADLLPKAGATVSVPLVAASLLHGLARRLGASPPLAVDALAVLGIDNEFDWRPAFEELGLDVERFARDQTFEPYWRGGA